MTPFTAYDSGFQAIMNYPNVRGLVGFSPVRSRLTEPQLQPESLELRKELEKFAEELSETPPNDNSPIEGHGALKRGREPSPESEDESVFASPAKRRRTDIEMTDADAMAMPEEDSYSIWDAMLWRSSCPGMTESQSTSSPRSLEQRSPIFAEPVENLFEGEFPVRQVSIPDSWNFTIWEDEDAGTDDYSMVGRRMAPWIPEYDDEDKENQGLELDVVMEDASVVPGIEYYYDEDPQFRRSILGELQQN